MGAQEEGRSLRKGEVLGNPHMLDLAEEGGNKKTHRIAWPALEEYILLFSFNQVSVGSLLMRV